MDVYLDPRLEPSQESGIWVLGLVIGPGHCARFVPAGSVSTLGIPCVYSGVECMTGASHSKIHKGPK